MAERSGAPTLLRLRVPVVMAALGALFCLLAPGVAAAATPAVAFYTWQAPGGAATHGQRVIALTFDDGPGPYTPQILSVLEQYHVPATFFEIGVNVASYPQYSKQLVAAGYPVENHTWSHPDLATLNATQIASQIDMTQNEIRTVTGETPTCLRPPYDVWNSTVLRLDAARGLTTMSYSVSPGDWSLPGVSAIVSGVVGAAFPGAVVDLHDGGGNRSETVAALPQIIVDLEQAGYTFVSICNQLPPPPQVSAVYGFGTTPTPSGSVTSEPPFVGAASSPSGYWLTAADGGVFAFGAPFFGSMGGKPLARPVVGMAATANGGGYWLVASDGGVFAFGDAGYSGSMGGKPLARPVVGMADDPATGGYWLVASDGGVFSFNAPYHGSMGGKPLNQPVVGMAATPTGGGYWLVASDGGIFAFGNATFYGSMGASPLNQPVVGMAADPATGGYWLVASDGGVFAFNAPWYGSRGAHPGPTRFFAMAASGGAGYLLAGEHPATTTG